MDDDESGDATSTTFDASGYVRRVRRLADLSQRDLARHLGTSQSTIARIEDGGEVRVDDMVAALALAGLRLAVVDAHGRLIAPMPAAVFHDRAGRRRPAHLDVHAVPERPTIPMLLHDCDPIPSGGVWHHQRRERDRLRAGRGTDATVEQLSARAARERPDPPRPDP